MNIEMTDEQRKQLEERNRKILDAVQKKSEKVCPGAIALIGIAGSFASGRYYSKSDLDPLIVINDDSGWKIADLFIQEDIDVAHDIYCTSWDNLRGMAEYNDPNIAKLMDSKIVWSADAKYEEELEKLRQKAREILSSPFGKEDYDKAENQLKIAEGIFVKAMTAEKLADVRKETGGVLCFIEGAIAMLNKSYFHYGTKYCYEELGSMEKRPENICALIENVVKSKSTDEIKQNLIALMREVRYCLDKAADDLSDNDAGKDKALNPPSVDNIRGTYEEMFSNWRNKMYFAAQTSDRHLAYMSLLNLSVMLADIKSEVDIGEYDPMAIYNPDDLNETAKAYDTLLERYLEEYKRAGIKPNRFEDTDAFIRYYLEDKSK